MLWADVGLVVMREHWLLGSCRHRGLHMPKVNDIQEDPIALALREHPLANILC